MHPQTHSPLFRLPREVRDLIYDEIISGYTVFVDEDPKPYNLGIIISCKQTYTETIKLFYKTMCFRFKTSPLGDRLPYQHSKELPFPDHRRSLGYLTRGN